MIGPDHHDQEIALENWAVAVLAHGSASWAVNSNAFLVKVLIPGMGVWVGRGWVVQVFILLRCDSMRNLSR